MVTQSADGRDQSVTSRQSEDLRPADGDNAGPASGSVGLIAAEVPLKKVPPLERKLQAELKNTAAVS